MKKKILLITGTSGFIGKAFLKNALHKGYEVIDILRYKNKKNKELNLLRKQYFKSYRSIFFKKNSDIKKKLKNQKVEYFINFATLYKSNHSHYEIPKFIDSNLIFPTMILDVIHNKVKKIINFGTMMQHQDGENYKPKNFYASTKSAFEMIINFYTFKKYNFRYYNLKLYESFSESDNRKKLIPTLLQNYKRNIGTTINSKKLELNIIHVNDIIQAVYIILNNELKSGSYCLKQQKNIKIFDLIKKINKKLKKKLKVNYLNTNHEKMEKSKIKVLHKWKPDILIENRIMNLFYHADY